MDLLDIQAIRRANFLLLLEECAQEMLKKTGKKRGAAAHLYRLTGVKQSLISQLQHAIEHSSGATRSIGDDTARALEKAGKTKGWMDHDHSGIVSDQALRVARLMTVLTAEQRQIIEQTAEAFARSNDTPPPVDGPDLRAPRPGRH